MHARVQAHALSDTRGLRAEESFLPYRFDPIDSPPPFSPIGGPFITRFTGSSHDEHGFLTKNPALVGRLNEHLQRKIEDHRAEIELARSDIQPGARTLFIAYGITARAMAEAVNKARAGGRPISALTVQSLWPAPEAAILAALRDADDRPTIDRIVVAELNLGDFRREVERLVYRWAARSRLPAPEIVGINRVDGELITPEQFLSQVL